MSETRTTNNPAAPSGLIWLGALIMCAALGWLIWSIVGALPPRFTSLQQVSGAVERVTRIDADLPVIELSVNAGSAAVVLQLQGYDRLPARDWPITSLQRGDRVVAWAAGASAAAAREIWQLRRGARRVVEYSDRADAAAAALRRQFAYAAMVALIGSWAVGAGMARRNRQRRTAGSC